jgi:transposase
MQIESVIGIDVSKDTLDVYVYKHKEHLQVSNDPVGFKCIMSYIANRQNTLVCFENTGLYSKQLSEHLNQQGVLFKELNPLELKRSMGIKRGKNDKVDAICIAEYAWLRREEIQPTRLPSTSIVKLRHWLTLRDKLVKQRAAIKSTLKEQKSVLCKTEYGLLFKLQRQVIMCLTKQIEASEVQLSLIIQNDQQLNENYDLIKSIKGVGQVLAWKLIGTTNNFTSFSTWRQYSSYSGCAPFENKSGKAVFKPSRVHYLANKGIKSLLTLAAMSAIQSDPELKRYYQQRVQQGKNKMATINIIRNKIIARAFAVIKRRTPYVDILKFAA